MGAIGQAIAKRLAAFDMPISHFSRRPVLGLVRTHHADLRSLAALMDILWLALPSGSVTQHLANLEALQALRSNGYLVNVGGGAAVNAQDVFEHEPQVPNSLIQSRYAVAA